jgi:hypothetical protein
MAHKENELVTFKNRQISMVQYNITFQEGSGSQSAFKDPVKKNGSEPPLKGLAYLLKYAEPVK